MSRLSFFFFLSFVNFVLYYLLHKLSNVSRILEMVAVFLLIISIKFISICCFSVPVNLARALFCCSRSTDTVFCNSSIDRIKLVSICLTVESMISSSRSSASCCCCSVADVFGGSWFLSLISSRQS